MSKLSVDTREFDEKIARISKYEDIDRIEKRVLRKGLNEIRKTAKSNLRKALPNATKRSPYYDDTLMSGVMQSITQEGHEIIGKVHVMGTRRSASGTFRLRFFEGGTVDRVKKSTGKSTGKIEPLNFFNNAVSSSEGAALTKIEQEWDNEIEKLLE